ncbi:hypothetical protein PFISCL1PPCAC_23555 [Pristionchus fissidentatus]|uniref:Uncharacterized protein n=1 Tax=Pristionchus fissidentatus TaxID=1538716 RepID=A0AAV5WNQ3_9BILA|nr:hypothetical protein PFISCL1PPCAC_23555 [Pristionchus fissidentatus]
MSLLTIILVLAVIALCAAFYYYKLEERKRMQEIKEIWKDVKNTLPGSDGYRKQQHEKAELETMKSHEMPDLDPAVRRAKARLREHQRDPTLATARDKPRTRPPSRRKRNRSSSRASHETKLEGER